MRPLAIAGALLGIGFTVVLASACTPGESSSISNGESITTETMAGSTTETLLEETTASSDAVEPASVGEVTGESLPVASERHQEGEPTIGLVAPSLTAPGLVVPSERPTLVLVVTGSCADCVSAVKRLAALVELYEPVAVVIGPADTPEMPEPWVVVASDEIARDFGGRDRPTAVVIGPDGSVLSRVRPYNRTGTEYDTDDIEFGLRIAANQTLGTPAAHALEAVDDGRSGPLPDTFLGIEVDGDLVEVSTKTGTVINRIAGLGENGGDEIAAQAFDDIVRVPGSETFAVSECCEPAAGFVTLLDDWDGYEDVNYTDGFNVWEVSASADGKHLAFSGYLRSIFELGTERTPSPDSAKALGASNGSNPDVAWLRHRLGVAYLHRGNSPAVVEVIELNADYLPISRRSFELAGPASALDVNASGNLVVAVNGPSGDTASGEVYDPDTGELLAEFAFETGVFEIDYDVTGRFLIYADSNGTARWQGWGESGVLGEGYRLVSW